MCFQANESEVLDADKESESLDAANESEALNAFVVIESVIFDRDV